MRCRRTRARAVRRPRPGHRTTPRAAPPDPSAPRRGSRRPPRPRGSACAPSPAPRTGASRAPRRASRLRDRPRSRPKIPRAGPVPRRSTGTIAADAWRRRARRDATPAIGRRRRARAIRATCTTSAPRSSDGAAATAAASIARSGVAMRTTSAPLPTSETSVAVVAKHATAAFVDAESGARPATATTRHPRSTSASPRVVPARPGPISATVRLSSTTKRPLTTASSRTPPVRSPAEDPMLPMQFGRRVEDLSRRRARRRPRVRPRAAARGRTRAPTCGDAES